MRGVAFLLTWVAAAAAPAPASGASPAESALVQELGADPARWRLDALRFTVADDRFRRADDAGFTSYQAMGVALSRGPRERLGLAVSNQMITERGGMRRVDEGNVVATLGRRFAVARAELELDVLVGLSVVGNLGGAHIQDGYHALLGGRRLDGRLQDRYPDRTSVGGLWGGHLRGRWPARSLFALTAGAGGNVALGDGLGRVRGSLGAAIVTRHVRVEAGDEVWRFFSRDPFLTMPGGYATGAPVHSPFLRVALTLRGFELAYEARANAGGSGQGISQLHVQIPLR